MVSCSVTRAEGAAPSQRTEVRVLYDKTYLYVAVRAFDSEPGKIVGIRTRRDGQSPSDWINVLVDSYHDRRSAYSFAVNAAGVKQDSYWFSDGNADYELGRRVGRLGDERQRRDGRPSSAFRSPSSASSRARSDTFGFAVVREIARLNEMSSWPLLAKSRSGFVSQFGELGGLKLARAREAPRTGAVRRGAGADSSRPVTGTPS